LGLTAESAEQWRRLSRRVAFRRREDGVWEQHAGFFELEPVDIDRFTPRQAGMYDLVGERHIERTQVIKQADVVMAMALFPESTGNRLARERNFAFYRERTDHGSSLSPAAYARVASDLGLRDDAYEFFRRAVAIDLDDSMGNGGHGLHAATLGGVLQAAIFGFGGLRLEGESPVASARLPSHWRSFGFSAFHHGQLHEWDLGRGPANSKGNGPAGARSNRKKGDGK
jgi:kojibiose phosphorylase